MQLNTLKPAKGAKKPATRVGRGIGSGHGKTCGRGHKGLKSRSGGKVRSGFEGGQNPLYRRIPKIGFTGWKQRFTAEVPLNVLAKIPAKVITLEVLKQHNIISNNTKFAKVIFSGKLTQAVTLQGIKVTKGARAQIEAAGGKVED